MSILQSFLDGGTKYPWKELQRQSLEQKLKVWPSRDCPTWDPSYKQPPNPDTIADTNKSLLTGAWYSCLLSGSASAWQIQKWMLTVIHWTKYKVPKEGARESTQGAEGDWSPTGGTSIWTHKYPQNSLELYHQKKKTRGVTCGSSYICSRGWPWWSSMGGEALGPVKVLCPSIGECQGLEVEVGWLLSRRQGEDRRFSEGKRGKGIAFEM